MCYVGNALRSEAFIESDRGVVLEHDVECDGEVLGSREFDCRLHEQAPSAATPVLRVNEESRGDGQGAEDRLMCDRARLGRHRVHMEPGGGLPAHIEVWRSVRG